MSESTAHLTRLGLERLIEEHFWVSKVDYSHRNLCSVFSIPRLGFYLYVMWKGYWKSINHYKITSIEGYFGCVFFEDNEASEFACAALRLLIIHEFLDYLESEGFLS